MEVLIPKPDVFYVFNPYRTALSSAQVLGPYHDSGDPWQSVKLSRDDLNRFTQGARLYGESSVYHRKVDGKIFVNPSLKSAIPLGKTDAISGFPLYRMTFNVAGSTKTRSFDTTIEQLLTGSETYNRGLNTGSCTGVYSLRLDSGIASCQATYSRQVKEGHRYILSYYRMKIISTTSKTCTFMGGGTLPISVSVIEDRKDLGLAISLAHSNFSINEPPANSSTTREKLLLNSSDFSMSQVRHWIGHLLQDELFSNTPSLNLDNWGDLVHAAADNINANSVNMIAFIADLKDIKSLIPKLKELKKLATHASNYLSVQYGVLPTIDDLKNIFEAFLGRKFYDRLGFRRVSAYDSKEDTLEAFGNPAPIQHVRRVHLAINENDTGLDALIEKARNIGFFPSLTNLWDLVPYSFVVDWFVDVGSILERIDTRHQLLNLDIPYVIKSDKITLSVKKGDLLAGIGAEFKITSYYRSVTTDVPQPRIFGEIGKPPTAQNHWVEGSALILQRTKN